MAAPRLPPGRALPGPRGHRRVHLPRRGECFFGALAKLGDVDLSRIVIFKLFQA